jgi:hypothetical protein
MLNRLLFQHQDRKQLTIAFAGAFLGMTFLISAIHYLIKVNEFGKGADILGPNTLIVQKKVSNSSSLNLNKMDFSNREIQKIRKEPYIEDAQPVISNNFDVSFETADPLVPRFRTDVFIQTVDPKFLDVKTKKWQWKEGDEFVPIIMPREFLVMLNTFMSASGIPPVSDDLAMDVKFKFKLKDESKNEYVDARIIGFTNEVSSILVPEKFMEYGNAKFTAARDKKITQLMISGKESEFGKLESLLKKRGLESKNSQMLVGRLKSVVGTLFLVVLGISIIAVFASGLVLIQYMQLLMSRNAYEVRTLMRIGHHPTSIVQSFLGYFLKVFGLICMFSAGSFLLLKYFLDDVFESGGLYIGKEITLFVPFAMLLSFVLFAFSSYLTAKKGIYNEF